MNQPADTNDLPVRVRRAAWLARAAFLLVFAINVQCAASFVLWPDVYAPSFEVAGVPGWWKQELPSEEEMQEGIENLAAHDNKVDFIVTHCCASSTQTLLGGGLYKTDILTEYHEKIRQNTSFKKWFFGHYHDNRNVNMEEILIYEQMIRI